jgi:hypothetical protein
MLDCSSVNSFEDFDVSADGSACFNTYVAVGPSPCTILCGTQYPRSYMSSNSDIWIRYVYRESAGPLRRGFKLKFVIGKCLTDFFNMKTHVLQH